MKQITDEQIKNLKSNLMESLRESLNIINSLKELEDKEPEDRFATLISTALYNAELELKEQAEKENKVERVTIPINGLSIEEVYTKIKKNVSLSNGCTYSSNFVNDKLILDIEIPLTSKEVEEYVKDRFSTMGYKHVYNLLTDNGYKRKTSISNTKLEEVTKDFTLYESYKFCDNYLIEEYYKVFFEKDTVAEENRCTLLRFLKKS